jgi:hypothetical protein
VLALFVTSAVPSRVSGSDGAAPVTNLALCPRSVHKLVDTAIVLGLSRGSARSSSAGKLADTIDVFTVVLHR